MANVKISQLDAASTPLTGAEEVPLVQQGVTKKVIVANLTDGRDVDVANLTATGDVSAHNLILQNNAATEDVTIRAPFGLAASYTLVLPDDAGASGNALLTDGAGTLSWGTPAETGVSSFNTRTGAVTLESGDVTGALGYTPLAPSAIGTTVEAYDATILKSADIGVTVEGYDATILKSADIGVTVQGYDATILKSADIGVTVQAYDADTAKTDTAQTWTATQSFNGAVRFNDADASNYAAIQAPSTLAANYTLTLPADDGTNGQVLSTDGTGVLSWVSGNTGTVTSVDASGGTTGMSFSGGPVTSSGTLTMSGTLAVANGGTGQTTANAALNALLPSQTGNNGKILSTDGSTTSWVSASTGTVTSVTGTAPIASSGGATPAISISQSSGSTDGYLSSTDWNTFNNKQPAGSYLTSVTADAPLSGSGTSGSHLVIAQAGAATDGYLSSTDWNTFNNKGSGTVTSVGGTGTVSGISLSGTVTSSGSLTLGGSLDLSSPPTIGNTTANSGAFTTLTTSSTVTLSGGTANGVAYLNGSKVLTTGSALTFDGTTLLVGTFNEGNKLTLSGTAGFNGTGISLLETSTGNNARLRMYQASGVSSYDATYASGGNAHAWLIGGSEQMRLTSTGLGIGTSSPQSKLAVSAGGAQGFEFLPGETSTVNSTQYYNRSGAAWVTNKQNALDHRWFNAGTEAMALDSSGNLGLGVTPSAWAGKALQVSTVSSYFQDGNGGANIGHNLYEQTANSYKYILNFYATRYEQQSGQHRWYTAPSGTAGNDISFTRAMTLDASGRLGLGVTNPGNRLQVEVSDGGNVYASLNNNTVQTLFGAAGTTGALAGATSNHPFLFYAGGSERMRIDSSGNVGIGTSSPAVPLQVLKGAAGADVAYFLNSGGYGVRVQAQTGGSGTNTMMYVASGESLALGTNNTERMRIDSSGNVLIQNTSSAPSTPASGGYLYIEGGALKYRGSSGTVTTIAPA